MKILLDTCIIIDALQDCQPFSNEARAIIDAGSLRYYDAYLTAKELTDIYYLMKNYCHSDKRTRKIISDLFSITNVIDTTSHQVYAAIFTNITDYEDAIMAQTAIQNNLDFIVTRNLKDFRNSPIPAISPADCLKKLGVKSWG